MRTILLLIIIWSVGCATEGKFKEYLDSYVGHSEGELVDVMGPPDSTYPMDNGDKILTYNRNNGVAFAYGRAIPVGCKINFKLSDNKVSNYQYQGNACKSK